MSDAAVSFMRDVFPTVYCAWQSIDCPPLAEPIRSVLAYHEERGISQLDSLEVALKQLRPRWAEMGGQLGWVLSRRAGLDKWLENGLCEVLAFSDLSRLGILDSIGYATPGHGGSPKFEGLLDVPGLAVPVAFDVKTAFELGPRLLESMIHRALAEQGAPWANDKTLKTHIHAVGPVTHASVGRAYTELKEELGPTAGVDHPPETPVPLEVDGLRLEVSFHRGPVRTQYLVCPAEDTVRSIGSTVGRHIDSKAEHLTAGTNTCFLLYYVVAPGCPSDVASNGVFEAAVRNAETELTGHAQRHWLGCVLLDYSEESPAGPGRTVVLSENWPKDLGMSAADLRVHLVGPEGNDSSGD